MKILTPSDMLDKFKLEVCAKTEDIDPDEERDWFCLSIGYFLALGAGPELSHELARTARYKYGYWQ